jgi:hypothetical protein
MLLDCQLKSLLETYFKTIIVGFGKADALGLSVFLVSSNSSKKGTKTSRPKVS